MRIKTAIGMLGVAAALALGACGDDEAETTTSTVTVTGGEATTGTTTTGTGTTTTGETTTGTATDGGTTTDGHDGEDVSGNCDEPEHANDPECQ